MLTLKELKKIVKVADMEKRIPSVKSLKEHKVVVKEMINADTTISVYDHGYVLYTAGNQSTVFPLHSCDDYEYVSVTGDNKELMIIPDAVHVDLYDGGKNHDKIPFDKIEGFFKTNLK